MRIDQLTWSTAHDKHHLKTVYGQSFQVVLPQITDRILVTVFSVEAQNTWYRAGWISQRWNRGITDVLINRKQVPINDTCLITLEPINNTAVWFTPVDWVGDFQLTIEINESYMSQIDIYMELEEIETRLIRIEDKMDAINY